MGEKPIGIGLLGCGIVGSGAARHLLAEGAVIERAVGVPLEIRRVAVRSVSKHRDVDLPRDIFTTDPAEVVGDPEVDVVVEVMGGIEPARTLVLEALAANKPVVTANKELLSTLGAELFEAAAGRGVDLYFEAAVCGGIPLLRPLRESLAGERIRRVVGIVNGTTNYVLTRMSEADMSFGEALAEAEELGFAEQDPTADIEGMDAAAKAAILASIAFRTKVVAGDVFREGISHVTHQDIEFATRLGYVVKLLAVCEEVDGQVAVRVHPAMLPAEHPLASVRESFNAVFVEGDAVGELMFYGRGAGGDPTGSAVVGDVVTAARRLRSGGRAFAVTAVGEKPIRPIDDMTTQYYVLLQVADQAGVLASIAGAFGEHGISIGSVWQEGYGDQAQLVMVTHRAQEAALQATVRDLEGLDAVRRIVSVLRVVGEEE